MLTLLLKVKQSSYNQTCIDNTTCTNNTNMVCINQTCLCPSPGTQYWNGSYCGKRFFYKIFTLKGLLKLIFPLSSPFFLNS